MIESTDSMITCNIREHLDHIPSSSWNSSWLDSQISKKFLITTILLGSLFYEILPHPFADPREVSLCMQVAFLSYVLLCGHQVF